jgi:hypothetical protein
MALPTLPARLVALADKWRPILTPFLSVKSGEGEAKSLIVYNQQLSDDDLTTLGGYCASLYERLNPDPIVEMVIALINRLPEPGKSKFKDAYISPLCIYATNRAWQGQMLYCFVKRGGATYDEIKWKFAKSKPFWFAIESGSLTDPAKIAAYARKRDERRGFGRVMDVLLHDDLEAFVAIAGLPNYSKVKTIFEGEEIDPELKIKEDRDLLPVGIAYSETQLLTFLEFACRWEATECINYMLREGAVPTPWAFLGAVQTGNLELIQRINAALPTPLEDGFEFRCALQQTIRHWRIEVLDWMAANVEPVGWDEWQSNWVWDNVFQCNNILAVNAALIYTPTIPPMTWMNVSRPLAHGNVELLQTIGDITGEKLEGEDNNFVRWAMQSGRLECIQWLGEHDPEGANEMTKLLEGDPLIKRWFNRRPGWLDAVAVFSDAVRGFNMDESLLD